MRGALSSAPTVGGRRCEGIGVMAIDHHDDSAHWRRLLCGGDATVFAAMMGSLLGRSKPARAGDREDCFCSREWVAPPARGNPYAICLTLEEVT